MNTLWRLNTRSVDLCEQINFNSLVPWKHFQRTVVSQLLNEEINDRGLSSVCTLGRVVRKGFVTQGYTA